jgi:hypothetical protein
LTLLYHVFPWHLTDNLYFQASLRFCFLDPYNQQDHWHLLFLIFRQGLTVGTDNPPVLKTDTQETENLDKAISLNQEGASMCSLPLSNMQAQNGWQWLLLISLTQLYLPLTWDWSRSKVHSLSWLAKRLGGWVRAYSLAGNGVVQESGRRSKDPLNLQVT